MSDTGEAPDFDRLTADIVSALVAHNRVAAEALPGLIQAVHATLAGLGQAQPANEARPEPAVPVKKSVQHDHIVCLEDGAKLKMLKRYLATRYQMTPERYRERWGLPHDYPMVAPAYAARRSELAKAIGLGRKRETEPEAKAAAKPRPRAPKKSAAPTQ